MIDYASPAGHTSLYLHKMHCVELGECHNGLYDRPCELDLSGMTSEGAEQQMRQLSGMAFLIPTRLLGLHSQEDAQEMEACLVTPSATVPEGCA